MLVVLQPNGTEAELAGTLGTPTTAAPANATAEYAPNVPLVPQVVAAGPRPYLGDVWNTFLVVFWPMYCASALVICTLGIFANIVNIIVLTRPNMITAVNAILSAIAFFDLLVNIVNIPYLMHEFSDTTDSVSFHTYEWAFYTLIYAHTTVTAHTISIWLTCALATWRYFVVCRSTSANPRNWSVALAKRTIVVVICACPFVCIPNYLTFAIVEEQPDAGHANGTLYKVGFSSLADRNNILKTFNFSIFSCLTKLVPCVFLTFFTMALINKLLKARKRRLRLTTTHPNKTLKISDADLPRNSLPNGDGIPRSAGRKSMDEGHTVGNGLAPPAASATSVSVSDPNSISNHQIAFDEPAPPCDSSNTLAKPVGTGGETNGDIGPARASLRRKSRAAKTDPDPEQEALIEPETGAGVEPSTGRDLVGPLSNGSSNATDPELVAISCDSSVSGEHKHQQQQQHRPAQHQLNMTQLIVETSTDVDNNPTTVTTSTSTTAAPTIVCVHELTPPTTRSASTCGALEGARLCPSSPEVPTTPSSVQLQTASSSSPLMMQSRVASSHELASFGGGGPRVGWGRLESHEGVASAMNLSGGGVGVSGGRNGLASAGGDDEGKLSKKRCSESTLALRGRSMGSASLAPFQLVKLQTSTRQLSQNETTTRLLIAVMIVFLICEFPAGFLSAFCAILGQNFFENVYQPLGALTDLLALINSSVNFVLYCCMSTQFRVTFYRVVLHCPAPSGALAG